MKLRKRRRKTREEKRTPMRAVVSIDPVAQHEPSWVNLDFDSSGYFSIRHPHYRLAERRFIGVPWTFVAEPPDLKTLENLAARLQQDDSTAVFDALDRVGLRALHPSREDSEDLGDEDGFARDEIRLIGEIRRLTWEHAESWYRDARYAPTTRERAAAADLLKRLGATLAGSRRGKRAKAVTDRFAVWLYYRQTLFRVLQAERLLKALRCCECSPKVKVKAVCTAYGISEGHFRRHLNFDDFGMPYRLRLTPEETARILTAERFGIKRHTIENILSSGSSK